MSTSPTPYTTIQVDAPPHGRAQGALATRTDNLPSTTPGITLRHLPDYQVILCVECKIGLPYNTLQNHFRIAHRGVTIKTQREVLNGLRDLPVAKTTADILPCPDNTPVLDFLRPPQAGHSASFLDAKRGSDIGGLSNNHLFSKQYHDLSCFTSAGCLKALQDATRDSPIPLNIRTYRHIAIAISKRHLPTIAKSFDPHAPKDYDGFLRLLAFQTGHSPTTHVGAYALETASPSKLQPDLIQRYLNNSRAWHEFTRTREEHFIEPYVDYSFTRQRLPSKAIDYPSDPPTSANYTDQESEVNSEADWQWIGPIMENDNDGPKSCSFQAQCWPETETSLEAESPVVYCGTKRRPLQDLSTPIAKKIKHLQRQLDLLVDSNVPISSSSPIMTKKTPKQRKLFRTPTYKRYLQKQKIALNVPRIIGTNFARRS